MVKIINKRYPIKLKELEGVIDSVHIRYPFLSKTEISIIVKTFFEMIRENLILGSIINFNKYFFDMKFFFSQWNKRTRLTVKVTPPPFIRELE